MKDGMKIEFLKSIYENLRAMYDGIDKKCWIWIDFFENKEMGFEHFEHEISNDKNYAFIKNDSWYNDKDLEFEATHIAYDIQRELNKSLAWSELCQATKLR